MNEHVENKWARLPKAWEGPTDIDEMPLSYEKEINEEVDAASINSPKMPFPQFVDNPKNLQEVAPTVSQWEEQEIEVEWAKARDKCLQKTDEGLATLQRNVAKSLVTVLDSLDRGQRLRGRARDTERRGEKERWRKSHAEMEKLMKRWVQKWEEGRRMDGWRSEKEDEEEAISGMCLELRRQVQMSMEKAESEREEVVTESDSTVAKQELAIMEVLMDQLGAVEETCGVHCKLIQDKMMHLWETIEKDRLARTENSGISEKYHSSVTPLATLEPCLVRRRRALLPPIGSLNEEGGKRSAIHTGAGASTQGIMWHMEPLAENHREKKKRKNKVEVMEREEDKVIKQDEDCENTRKSWKQRLTEWLHAPLCGCAVRCY